MTDTIVRAATVDDAHAIAVIHVRGWQTGYAGLMPQDFLDALSIEQREEGWRSILSSGEGASHQLVAERDGDVIGMASAGHARDEDAEDRGELWGIYVHPDVYSTGAGHALITAVEDALRADGFTSASLWVLEGNHRATDFYERHGWLEDGARKVDERPDLVLHERRRVKLLA
ncbi:MAG: GNAT family N-acetyltransferase [Microbacterium sp.]